MPRQHNEEKRMDGLMALALYGGQASPAARALKEQGRPIPRKTLADWRERYPADYLEARRIVREQVVARTSDLWRHTVQDAAEAVLEATAAARQAIANGDSTEARKWSGTSRDMAVVGGIGDDKAARSDGIPEIRVVEHRSDTEIIRKLKALGVVIEGEAEEIQPPELTGGDTLAGH